MAARPACQRGLAVPSPSQQVYDAAQIGDAIVVR